MKYPKEYLDEIKLRLKVSQVVGKTVQLKKRGKEFIGLSPFKNEKSPSFTVNDEKEFYHCFSSGEHGNIFDFLMKTKSIGFGEAVRSLAAEAGMQPYRFSNFDQKKDLRFQTYKNIFKDYSYYFHQKLFNSDNEEAREYLLNRGLDKKIIEEFQLGYVPWQNNFYEELLKKYSEEEINLTGLYYKSDKTGKYIDRFNSRIIFPINNIIGDTIAFGGRIIRDGKLAKYINSPETEFYKKGNMIYNLDKAKDKRSETNEVLIVEGYMDVVSVYASGIKNVIANSGTALTERQINLIWKFFSNPIICLDGDESGQKAASRIAERLFPLINENNKIYFSIMPEGQDPDDVLRDGGPEAFQAQLERAVDASAVLWRRFLGNIRSQSSREEVLPPSCCFRQGPPNPSCCACPLSLQRHPAPPLCTRKTQGRDAHDFPRTFSQVLAQRDKALKDCRTVRLGILCWRASLEKVLAVARGNPARLEKMLENAEQEQRSRSRGGAPSLSSRNMKSRRDRGAGMPAKHRRLLLQWRRDCWGDEGPAIFSARSRRERVEHAQQLAELRCFGDGPRLCRLLGEVEGMLTELSLAFLPARELSW